MRRLHLKLFYLRTRVRREPQGVTAKTLGVRPATMSHLEQGRSLPTLPMLAALCRHYDVMPGYLLDDERPIEPRSGDRASERVQTPARGQWIEVPEGAVIRTADGMLLCPVMSQARIFDAATQAARIVCNTTADAERLAASAHETIVARDRDLEAELQRELLGQRKPRRRAEGVESELAADA